MKSLTTLKLTSASSRAMRISRIARSRCSADRRLSPRKSLRTFLSLSDKASNIGQSHGERFYSGRKTERIRTCRLSVKATIYIRPQDIVPLGAFSHRGHREHRGEEARAAFSL